MKDDTITITGPAELVAAAVVDITVGAEERGTTGWYVKDSGNPQAVEVAPLDDDD